MRCTTNRNGSTRTRCAKHVPDIRREEGIMAEDDAGLRDRNVAIATELMERFGHDMDGWYDHLHDDIVMEFPFGACVGMPTRLEGREACAAVFQTVCDAVPAQFSIIRICSGTHPSEPLSPTA